jgi:alpha-beta hydrolase superfamily lysophospholipase
MIQYALNGMLVHAVDVECHGYAGGSRAYGLRIDSFHFIASALLEQFEPGLRSFVYGHSMGCMLLNTFLLKNPGLALDGVIFSAPFFGFSEVFGMSPARIFLMQIAAPFLSVSQTFS